MIMLGTLIREVQFGGLITNKFMH